MNKKTGIKQVLLNLELQKYNEVRKYAFKKEMSITDVIREAIIRFFEK
jgi:hypothetical protein